MTHEDALVIIALLNALKVIAYIVMVLIAFHIGRHT